MDIIGFLSRKKLSQAELAVFLGVTSANVNKWVNGKGYPSYECCKKLLNLGISLRELFDIDPKTVYDFDDFEKAQGLCDAQGTYLDVKVKELLVNAFQNALEELRK